MLTITSLYTVVDEVLEVTRNDNIVVENIFLVTILDEKHVMLKQSYNSYFDITSKYAIVYKQIKRTKILT